MSTTIFKMPDDTEIPLVVDPADQTIADEGGYFESDNVEDVLQEIGEALNDIPDTPEIPEEVTVGATPAEGAKIFIDTAAHFGDYLYNDGNEYTDITGGWELLSIETALNDISFSKESTYISFVRTGFFSGTSKIRIVANKKIDLTNIDKLKFYASTTNANRSAIDIYINLAKSDVNMINLVHNTDFPTPIIADVSDYTGEYYVIFEFSVWNAAVEGQLTIVELEFNADTPDETLKYLINGKYVAMDYVRRKDVEANKNVQADWNQADASSGSYIKNKPTIPTVPPDEVAIGAIPGSGTKIFIDTAAHFGDYLYNEGNEYTDITGGWELLNVINDNISFSKETDHIKFVRTAGSSADSRICIVTNKKIDLTNIDKLKFYAGKSISNRFCALIVYVSQTKSYDNKIALVDTTDFSVPAIVNTSNYTGEYYVMVEFMVWTYSGEVEGRLNAVELEFNPNTPDETLKYLFNGTYKSLSLVRPSDLANIPVTDAGGYFEATTVEGVLQEIGSKLAELLTPSS